MSKQIFQKRVKILPEKGELGVIYYIENGQGTNLDQYIADNNGLLRLVGKDFYPDGFNNVKSVITLGESVSGGNVLYMASNGKFYKYNHSDLNLYNRVAGLANSSGLADQLIDIITNGECDQLGGLITGDTYYGAENGLVTNIPPVINIFQQLGIAKSATTLIVGIQKPYIKI